MKRLLILASLLLIAGCGLTPVGDQYREAARMAAKTVADQTLANVEWALCNAMTIGAITRRYGRIPTKATAYRNLCREAPTLLLTP